VRIMEVFDGDVASRSLTSDNLTLEVEVPSGCAESVQLQINGNGWMAREDVPYSLQGDSGGFFFTSLELSSDGWHLIEVQAYTGPGLTGDAGPLLSLNIQTIP
jgi:hypothetical protein